MKYSGMMTPTIKSHEASRYVGTTIKRVGYRQNPKTRHSTTWGTVEPDEGNFSAGLFRRGRAEGGTETGKGICEQQQIANAQTSHLPGVRCLVWNPRPQNPDFYTKCKSYILTAPGSRGKYCDAVPTIFSDDRPWADPIQYGGDGIFE